MTHEDLTHVGVLLENIQTSVKVLAEGHVALVERFDRMDGRFDKLESRFDRLEMRFDGLETRFDGLETRFDTLETRVGGLEVFASDTQQRLQRIEGHLELNGARSSRPRRKVTRAAPQKRRKKA